MILITTLASLWYEHWRTDHLFFPLCLLQNSLGRSTQLDTSLNLITGAFYKRCCFWCTFKNFPVTFTSVFFHGCALLLILFMNFLLQDVCKFRLIIITIQNKNLGVYILSPCSLVHSLACKMTSYVTLLGLRAQPIEIYKG